MRFVVLFATLALVLLGLWLLKRSRGGGEGPWGGGDAGMYDDGFGAYTGGGNGDDGD